ncbi:hypothetical protein F4703DRAFT_1930144 [Phycomyces blakesleeanus]
MTVQGFWGLEIKPNKVYKQVVPSPFQLIMVALDHDNAFTTRSSLVVKVDERELILCSLSVGQKEQQYVNIGFCEGELISISVKGPSTMHLTGNYIFEEDAVNERSPSPFIDTCYMDESKLDVELGNKEIPEDKKEETSNKRVRKNEYTDKDIVMNEDIQKQSLSYEQSARNSSLDNDIKKETIENPPRKDEASKDEEGENESSEYNSSEDEDYRPESSEDDYESNEDGVNKGIKRKDKRPTFNGIDLEVVRAALATSDSEHDYLTGDEVEMTEENNEIMSAEDTDRYDSESIDIKEDNKLAKLAKIVNVKDNKVEGKSSQTKKAIYEVPSKYQNYLNRLINDESAEDELSDESSMTDSDEETDTDSDATNEINGYESDLTDNQNVYTRKRKIETDITSPQKKTKIQPLSTLTQPPTLESSQVSNLSKQSGDASPKTQLQSSHIQESNIQPLSQPSLQRTEVQALQNQSTLDKNIAPININQKKNLKESNQAENTLPKLTEIKSESKQVGEMKLQTLEKKSGLGSKKVKGSLLHTTPDDLTDKKNLKTKTQDPKSSTNNNGVLAEKYGPTKEAPLAKKDKSTAKDSAAKAPAVVEKGKNKKKDGSTKETPATKQDKSTTKGEPAKAPPIVEKEKNTKKDGLNKETSVTKKDDNTTKVTPTKAPAAVEKEKNAKKDGLTKETSVTKKDDNTTKVTPTKAPAVVEDKNNTKKDESEKDSEAVKDTSDEQNTKAYYKEQRKNQKQGALKIKKIMTNQKKSQIKHKQTEMNQKKKLSAAEKALKRKEKKKRKQANKVVK